jgi:polyferredoxin
VNLHSRDWPPDPATPKPQLKPPPRRVVIMLLAIVLLLVGSPLAAWFVAMIPAVASWWSLVIPAGWFVALLVFLAGSYLDIRSRR